MLTAFAPKSGKITEVAWKNGALFLTSERGKLRITPKTEQTVRITYTERETFSDKKKPGVILEESSAGPAPEVFEETDKITFRYGKLMLEIARKTGAITYFSAEGELLLCERQTGSRELESFTTYELFEDGATQIEKIQTADGEKEVIRSASRVPNGSLYHTRLLFGFQEKEAVYGLGQQENGPLNLRHQTVYLHQANRKIAIPMFVSSLGYGILSDTYSPMIFSETKEGAHIYTEADEELDYYFLFGGTPEGVVSEYRKLTGKAALLPRWAFGYWQSQERYETQEELLSVAKEYRRRGLGLDALVLDWCSWTGNLWGQKTMDPERFPNPKAMTEELHRLGVHFMISIWPNMSEECDNYREMKEAGRMLPGSPIYNAFSEEARKLYWEQVERGLFCHGIDAWWCDSSEPYTPEWNHLLSQEPGVAFAEYCKETADHMPADRTNAFGFFHAQTLFEGQRKAQQLQPEVYPDRRVCNLTRSAYTGSQRFGTVLWSGDTAASWDTFRQQLCASLNFAASGLPYWTTDIGAFFVKNGFFWYWKGDYDKTTKDLGYCELYTRWFQWAAFLPIFRAHGTDCHREMWQFENEEDRFYRALVRANERRYRFLPYIYSLAGTSWQNDGMIIKPLAFAFPKQELLWDISDQYLFGDSVMVCPVTEPMYYSAGSEPIPARTYRRKVYLPDGCGWFDFDTEEYYRGGQWIETSAPIDRIPVFVRAGSILPMGRKAEHTGGENEIAEFVVYGGADASFTLYEDAGDGYAYEKGEYRTVKLSWDEQRKKLSFRTLVDGMPKEKVCEPAGIPVRLVGTPAEDICCPKTSE